MATTKIIGKVSIIPCGTYVDGTTYTRLSVVNYQGGSYIALVDNTNIVPTNDSVWYLLTAPGRGIQQIEKIGTVGLVDTYRITYTDGTHFDYTVNNGASKTSELTNDAGFITNQVDDLANYLLAIDTGAYIELSYDSEGYTVTANLKNSSDTIISTGTAQLPLGGNYVSSSYNDGIITLTKLNGTSDTIELNDLVKKSTTIAGLYLADNITTSELIEALDVYTIPEINDNFVSSSTSGESIYIDNSSNLALKGFQLKGNATQDTSILTYKCVGTETGDYYFVYNSTNYQFTMPTVASGDILAFNTTTKKLYQGTTEITTTTASTGTLITLSATPNPDYPQDIHVVTGDNTVKVLGKNFFDGNNPTSIAGYTSTSFTNDILTVNKTALSSSPTSKYAIWEFNNLKENDVVRINGIIQSTDGRIRLYYYDTSYHASTVLDYTNGTDISSISYTVPSTVSKVAFYIYSNKTGTTELATASYKNVIATINDSNTTYEPYISQTQLLSLGSIELAKIGDYTDRIYKSDGKWYKQENIGKVVYTGATSENWKSSGSNLYTNSLASTVASISSSTEKAGFSNYFMVTGYNYGTNPNTLFFHTNKNLQIAKTNSIAVDVETFTTWLSTHNTTVYYPLATPTTTEITDTTLIGQLENVLKMRTYNNITNILTQTNNAQPYLYIDYYINNVEMIKDMQEENTKLYKSLLDQIPQVTIDGQSINVKDSSNLPIQDFQIQGNISQNTNIMTYVCSGNESGYYYFVYNNTNYQFIMPTITQGELLTFNTTTLTLYQGTIEIATTIDNTGTLITLSATPNPDYPQDIHVVTGDNTITVINKNYFVGFSYTRTNNQVTYEYYTDGRINVDGTASSISYSMQSSGATPYLFKLSAGRYTLSGGSTNAKLQLVDSVGGVLITTNSNTGKNTINISNDRLAFVRVSVSGGDQVDNETLYPMLERSEDTTSYEVGKKQTQLLSLGSIELVKIGDYTDKIFHAVQGDSIYDSLDSTTKASLTIGKWYKQGNIKKYNLGDLDWTVTGTGTANYFYKATVTRYLSPSQALALCTHFQRVNITSTDTNIGWTLINNNTVRIRNTIEQTPTDFATWLTQGNAKIYYILETPTYIEITDAKLIAQLENVLKMTTYKNITNIFDIVVSPNETPYLQIIYKQDLDTLLDNLDARISLLE